MKIILLKDVKGVGRTGEIREVRSGYARNFLLPKGHARLADKAGLKLVENQKLKKIADAKKSEENAKKLAKILMNRTFEFQVSADKAGHLYAGLKEDEILTKIKESADFFPVDAKLENYKPVKAFGEYVINLKLSPDIKMPIKIIVKK